MNLCPGTSSGPGTQGLPPPTEQVELTAQDTSCPSKRFDTVSSTSHLASERRSRPSQAMASFAGRSFGPVTSVLLREQRPLAGAFVSCSGPIRKQVPPVAGNIQKYGHLAV